jgi:uncharacterized protein (TIGR00251 family)
VLRISQSPDGVAFWIHVTPRSRRERVGGRHGDALRVRVGTAPVEGAANAACVEALARALGVRSRAVELDPGSRSRRKRVKVVGEAGPLARRLEELAAEPIAQ